MSKRFKIEYCLFICRLLFLSIPYINGVEVNHIPRVVTEEKEKKK